MTTIRRTFLLSLNLSTQDHAVIQNLRDINSISTLRQDFSSIVLTNVHCSLFQLKPCGDDNLVSGGILYAGLVPSDWTVPVVLQNMTVANGLLPFNCTYEDVITKDFNCDLSTFEVDLALKDRRGALPRIALCSSGIHLNAVINNFQFASLRVTLTLECSGQAYGV